MAKVSTTTTAGRGSIWPPVSTSLWVEVQALANISPSSAAAPSAALAAPTADRRPGQVLPARASRLFMASSLCSGSLMLSSLNWRSNFCR
jgi:hypothetical protein